MSSEVQRVVMIEDASKQISPVAIKRTIQSSSLKARDKLLILRVLQQVTNPMGHKVKVDPDSIFGASQKMIEEEIARKKEEYINNEEIRQVLEECQIAKIEYHIEVEAASSLKVAVWKAAKSFQATWVILDRQMKKDKYFLFNKLRCGISRVKSNNRIEKLRGPKKAVSTGITAVGKPVELGNSPVEGKHGEVIPGNSEEELSLRKSPCPLENGESKSGNDSADHPLDVQTKSPITNSSSSGRAESTKGSANHPPNGQTRSPITNFSSTGEVGSTNGSADHPLDVQKKSPITNSSSSGGARSTTNGSADYTLDVQTQSSNANPSSSQQSTRNTDTSPGNAEASSSSYTDSKYSPMHFQSEATTTDTEWQTTREEWEAKWQHSPRFLDIQEMKLARSFYEGQILE